MDPNLLGHDALMACGTYQSLPKFAFELHPLPAVMDAMEQHDEGVMLLMGPPGCGKTAAMVQHYHRLVARSQGPVWVQLHKAGGDEATFIAHLLAACEAAGTRGSTIFLDGYDELSPKAATIVDAFLEDLAPEICCFTALRSLTRKILMDAVLRGQLAQIRPEKFQWDDQSAAVLLGQQLGFAQAYQLNSLASGWAAGLRFLVLDPDAQRRLLLSSDDAAIPLQMAEYFETTLCAAMPTDQLAALMDASVLDRFTSEALAMITQGDDSWPLIAAQIRDGTFISYLDENRLWVAFHPMFGRHLRGRLRAHNPTRFVQLHRRAATWFADHGFGIEAARHAQYLPDAIVAARIIEGAGGIRAEMGQARWLSLERLATHGPLMNLPMVSLSQIYGLMRNGDLSEARHAFEQLRMQTADFQSFDESVDASSTFEFSVIVDTLLTVTEDRTLSDDNLALLEQLFHGHQATDPVAKGSVSSVLTHIYAEQGRYDDAQLISDAGLQILRPCGPTKAGVFLRIQQAMNVLAHGNVGKSMLILDDAERLSRNGGKFEPYENLAIQIVKSELLFEDGQLGKAALMIQHALAEMGHVGSWLNLTLSAFSVAANLALRTNGFAAAMDIATQAEQLARRRNWPRLQQYMAVQRLYLMTRCAEWSLAVRQSETPDFEAILNQNSDRRLKIRALMEIARLHEEMGRPAEALRYLQRVELPPLAQREVRDHFRFHMLTMRAKFGLRRYNGSYDHMVEALQGAAAAGLRLRVQDNLPRFMDVSQWAERFGKKLPPAVAHYLKEVAAWSEGAEATATRVSQAPRTLAHNFALSPRETEVIALMAEGYLTKEIADRLGISDGTVKSHRKKIHEKLNVSSKSQAITRARELLII